MGIWSFILARWIAWKMDKTRFCMELHAKIGVLAIFQAIWRARMKLQMSMVQGNMQNSNKCATLADISHDHKTRGDEV